MYESIYVILIESLRLRVFVAKNDFSEWTKVLNIQIANHIWNY